MSITQDQIQTSGAIASAPSDFIASPRQGGAGVWRNIELAWILAWYDVRHRYARSVIGPFWITLQTLIFIVCIGFVFSGIFNSNIDKFLPFFAVGMVVWNLFSGATTNATTTLPGSAAFMKDRGLPAYLFFVQCFFRHVLLLAHNIIIPIVIFLIYGGASLKGLAMALPGLAVFAAVTLCCVVVVGALATRYRDVQPIVESVMNLAFLASPIMWQPGVVAGREYITEYNPIAHLMAVWRDPLMHETVPWGSFGVSLAILGVLALLTARTLRQLKHAAFWV